MQIHLLRRWIFTPWSLLNCIEGKGQLQHYWLNTSDNALVKDCLYRSGLIHKETFEQLLAGQTVSCLIDEYIVFPNLNIPSQSDTVILNFLLMAGYFTVLSTESSEFGVECQLAIPNLEVGSLYKTLIYRWLVEGQDRITINAFLGELLSGDILAFEKSFRFLLENTVSVHDLSQKPEAFYHGFMTGLTAHLQSHPDYELKSNRESGYGRYDYLILSRVPEKPTLLMEFKRVRFADTEKPTPEQIDMALEKEANEALKQIEAKAYDTSMLRYFFTKEADSEKTHRLFDDLDIQKEVDIVRQHQGQYPVIFLTFKNLKYNTFEKTYRIFCELIAALYGEHHYLINSPALQAHEKSRYQALLKGKAPFELVSLSLKNLSEYLHRYYEVAPIILIDEYDTPIQAGYLNGYYSEVVELFRHFLGAGLKDNSHCSKAVLTGILRVSKESLFSGLNNIRVYSVLQQRYGEYFGFTESEVQALLEHTGLEKHHSAIRSWYNGYQIGPHTIYNPWSLLNCIEDKGQLQRYWLNTSDNALVKDCLYRSGLIHKETFEQLLAGQTVPCLINENVVFPNLHSPSQSDAVILSFLLMAGYFTAHSIENTKFGTQCQLVAPNLEVEGLYEALIYDWLVEGQDRITINAFLGELLSGDIPAFEKSFRFLLENTVSVHDLSQKPEAFYHGFMAGLTAHLQSHPDYELKSNRESGYGRYDYLILSRVLEKPTLLMEFKRVRFADTEKPTLEQVDTVLEKAADEALKQIEAKAYDTGLKSHQLIKIAIAFCGKRFKLMTKKL